jgi:hypothetical protein
MQPKAEKSISGRLADLRVTVVKRQLLESTPHPWGRSRRIKAQQEKVEQSAAASCVLPCSPYRYSMHPAPDLSLRRNSTAVGSNAPPYGRIPCHAVRFACREFFMSDRTMVRDADNSGAIGDDLERLQHAKVAWEEIIE